MPIEIQIPGSKSITNRALILAALSKDTTIIKNSAVCDDTIYLIKGLKKLGIKIIQSSTTIKVIGNGGKFPKRTKPIKLFVGNAGTTTRFLTALATLTGNKIIMDGNKRMRNRPIKELTDALNKLGTKITTTNGHLPLRIDKQPLKGGNISLPGNISSQYLSALLLTAPFANQSTFITIEQKLCSRPYIEMTLKALKSFKIDIKNKNFRQFMVEPIKRTKTTQPTKTYEVESDASSASYMGAYTALHPDKTILLRNICKNSIQGDIKFLSYLKKMGCKIIEQKNGTLVKGASKLKSLGTVDMNETPDLVMTFSVLALFTKGKTRITNIGNLRIKETDRISALENELKKLAEFYNLPVKVKTGPDWIEVTGLGQPEKVRISTKFPCPKQPTHLPNQQVKLMTDPEKNLSISTYNDHRIAMAFGILTDIFRNLTIENPSCVSKSYTTFWEDLKEISKTN
jgi:3-phosphoshikimate 1-carboxyvinyltransferase